MRRRPKLARVVTAFVRLLLCLAALVAPLGCVTPTDTPADAARYGPVVPPPTAEVTRLQAWRDAETLASLAPGRTVVVGSGASMRPVYGDSTILVLEKVPFDSLVPDTNVAYINRHGRVVVHRLVAREGRHWRVAGLNNPREDTERVTPHNFLGVIYAAFANEDVQ